MLCKQHRLNPREHRLRVPVLRGFSTPASAGLSTGIRQTSPADQAALPAGPSTAQIFTVINCSFQHPSRDRGRSCQMETPQAEPPSRVLWFCLRGASEGTEGLVQINAWRLISKWELEVSWLAGQTAVQKQMPALWEKG